MGQLRVPDIDDLVQVLRAEFGISPQALHFQRVRDVYRSRGLLGYVTIEDDHAVRKERSSCRQGGTMDGRDEAVARIIGSKTRDGSGNAHRDGCQAAPRPGVEHPLKETPVGRPYLPVYVYPLV